MREHIPHSNKHNAIIDQDGAIECPICAKGDGGYLHPLTFRTADDYMETDFYCEFHTERVMTLRMGFHKGKTYMFWLKENEHMLETKQNPYRELRESDNEHILPF